MAPWGGMLPGFIAVSGDTSALMRAVPADDGISTAGCGQVDVAYWGLHALAEGSLELALSPVLRTSTGTMAPSVIVEQLSQDPAALTALLPPFAAARFSGPEMIMVADSMGFRQVYHTAPSGAGTPALGTSALVAARAHGSVLDDTALAVQSLLGWQLGQRTLFSGVQKLAPGAVARLTGNAVGIQQPRPADDGPLTLHEAVQRAARLLRGSLESILDDHPDAVLQLTGGQDSRLLLSAIPVARRRGLRAMTLGVATGDVEVASRLAQRYGLQHETHPLDGLDHLSPDQAWALTRTAALRLDGMSDPIALAALTVGERNFEQGVRISGLGGEVARGFYYLGKVRERAVTKAEALHLAAWRMFVNESVERGLLDDEFSSWARDAADNEVLAALTADGKDWDRATDDLYLRHRMQRWAGVTDTAVAYQRTVINPMLDEEFLALADRLSPADKASSLFLSRLQMELDPELGRIPLEGRPAPIAYAEPNALYRVSQRLSKGKRLVRKAMQRLQRGNRPPAGGDVLSDKVVSYWRQNPDTLSGVAQSGYVRTAWLEGMLDGTIRPRPSSVAFLSNLMVAVDATSEHRPTQPTGHTIGA